MILAITRNANGESSYSPATLQAFKNLAKPGLFAWRGEEKKSGLRGDAK